MERAMPVEYDYTPDEPTPAPTNIADPQDKTVADGLDFWFARRIAVEHGGVLKYVKQWKRWLHYSETEGRWVDDQTDTPVRLALQTTRRMAAEALALPFDSEARKKLWGHVCTFQQKKHLFAALELAKSQPEFFATADEWDADPYLLNCVNGVVDLRTGKLREHKPEDRMRNCTGVAFDPKAATPVWDEFLRRVQPNATIREFLQRAAGYSAIGKQLEHIFLICYGDGANGKTVFTNAIFEAQGDYSLRAHAHLVVKTQFPQHDTIKAALFGKRLAVISETAEDDRLDEAKIKETTGGDRITGRRMREDPWDFPPSHTYWMHTNYKPEIRDESFGLWRRLLLIDWLVSIPKDQQDRSLPDKLRAEFPGILAWVVEGARLYCELGLKTPQEVILATDEYREDQDALKEWTSQFEVHHAAFLSGKDAYADYVVWATAQGVKPWTNGVIKRKLNKKWPKKKVHGQRGYGVRRTTQTQSQELGAQNVPPGVSAAKRARVAGNGEGALFMPPDSGDDDFDPGDMVDREMGDM
jgi:putative DNA primase/helicase